MAPAATLDDRELRLQKLLSSAGYCGVRELRSELEAKVEAKAEAEPLSKPKASPGRQPRQFSSRPPRPESARKPQTLEAPPMPKDEAREEVDCSPTPVVDAGALQAPLHSPGLLDDEPPEAPMEGRTQELINALRDEATERMEEPTPPALPRSPMIKGSVLTAFYDSEEEEVPEAPVEGKSQEETQLEEELSGGLLSCSFSSFGDTWGGPAMPKAPEEIVMEIPEKATSPHLPQPEKPHPEEPSRDLLPEPPYMPPEVFEEPLLSPIMEPPKLEGTDEAQPVDPPIKETKEATSTSGCEGGEGHRSGKAKMERPTIRQGARKEDRMAQIEPPMAVVGHGQGVALSRNRPTGRATSKGQRKSFNAKQPASIKSRVPEPVRPRCTCGCGFCPSCRRRLDEENMRQAIERSLQTFLGDSQETLPMTRSEESSQRQPRPGSRGRSAVAAPGRRREDAQSCPRSAPTLPTRSGTRRTVSQVPSSERLRQHTRASQARIVAGRSRSLERALMSRLEAAIES